MERIKITTVRPRTTCEGVRRLSALDRVTAGMVIKGVWWFREGLDGERLRDGLAALLERRPWLAGRLTAEGMAYGAESGVPFAERTLPELHAGEEVARRDALDRLALRLSAAALRRGKAAPLAVALIHAADGALLYVQGAHVCMDGYSFYGMVDDWARLCRGEAVGDMTTESRLTDPDFADDPDPAPHAVEYGYVKVGMGVLLRMVADNLSGVSRRRFVLRLTDAQLAALVARVNDGGTHYGRHVALAALLAAAEMRLAGVAADVPCSQVSVVNLRGRMAGVPAGFDGNAVYNVASQPFSAADSVPVVADAIDRALRGVFADGGGRLTEVMRCYMTVLRDRLPYVPFDVAGMQARRSTVCYVNDFLGFPIYGADFGTGVPAAVLPPDLSDKVRLWPLPPQQGGGVAVIFAGRLAGLWARCADPVGWLEQLAAGKIPH